MTLKVYDTLSGQKEEFEPLEEGKVKMYVCGQTVYDYMHIGHGKTYIAFDIIRRYLEHKGYDVKTVINITDVNEKILNRADEENVEYWDIVEEYSEINIDNFEEMGVNGDVYPKASEYIQEMIDMVQKLIERGHAYEVDGDVFFDVRSFEDYGKLSNQDIDDLSSERDDIISSDKKKNQEDFVLWRKKDVEPSWESPWGKGWPGWHIECSAMSVSVLGETIDIHGGGSDLVFPHHENEIAQSEGCSGKEFARYWMNSGLVRMGDDKMSKSLGNFVSTEELLDRHDPGVLRLMVASSHYRSEMTFSENKLEESEKKLQRLKNTVSDLEAQLREVDLVPDKYDVEDMKTLDDVIRLENEFENAMDDDFNTPEALKHLMELSSELQGYMERVDPKGPALKRGMETIKELGNIIGILEDR
ncbi:MAG: cysteine--tRNA ligase, partial [Candidatus Aenigmatarchaeota archaeon]